LIILSGVFTILQAPDLYAFPFDPLWFFKNSLPAHKANVRGGEVVDDEVNILSSFFPAGHTA